jgi:hypothetical protein
MTEEEERKVVWKKDIKKKISLFGKYLSLYLELKSLNRLS